MVDPKLVDELVLRAGVSRADAEAVLAALGQIAPERIPRAADAREASPPPVPRPAPALPRYAPGPGEVQALIAAAEAHPLGLEFLLHGDPSAVAITFQVHAFSVDAARQQLARRAL
jgi:hypothetical protein